MENLFENQKFEIVLDGLKIFVSELTIKDQQIFRLTFSDNRQPLVVTVAKTWEGTIWTSIPQGRQKEAEIFGKQISDHLKA